MKEPKPKKLPSGMWRVQLQCGGQRISITRATKKECADEARALKTEYLAGKKHPEPEPEPEPVDLGPPLGKAIDSYIESRSNTASPSTIRGYKIIRRTRFQSVMTEPLDSVDWQAAINEDAGSGISEKTLRNAFSLVKSVYSENGRPAPRATLPQKDVKEKLFLTTEEIKRLVTACRGDKYEIGILLGLHGLRRSEIYGLEWDDIDTDAGTIHVHRSAVMNTEQEKVFRDKNKNTASTRTVPIMIPALLEAVKASKQEDHDDPHVITAHLNKLNDAVNRVCKSAGLPLIGLHGLRHSFASMCYHLGLNELQAMRLGGWSDFATMRRIYTHIDEKEKIEGAKTISKFFEE